jgi:hypothetical protein
MTKHVALPRSDADQSEGFGLFTHRLDAVVSLAAAGDRSVWITLYIKDDGLNPTASLKDRASGVAVAKAIELGYDTISCSSTGNAASSCAGSAARIGAQERNLRAGARAARQSSPAFDLWRKCRFRKRRLSPDV